MLASFPDARVLASFGSRHHGASFEPDRESLITSGHDGLRVWDLPSLRGSGSGMASHVLHGDSTILDESPRTGFARSENGVWLATVNPGSNSRIRVMERATGGVVAEFSWAGASIISLLFDPRSRWLAASYWLGNGFVVWDTTSWRPVAKLAPEVQSMQLSVNRDGSLVASCSASEVRLWDTSTWECLRRFPCEPASSLPYPVDFSPDGTILAYGHDPTHVRLVRVIDGTLIATLTLPVHDEMRRVLFSPDQKFLGVSSETRSCFFDLQRISNHLNAIGLEMLMP
jgi:WD40 repeat protein